MKKSIIICPCCGEQIKLKINKSLVEIDEAFFDIKNQEVLKEKLKTLGIEFGEKVGENN